MAALVLEWLHRYDPPANGCGNGTPEGPLNDLNDHFDCPICKCGVVKPRQTRCGHVYCTACLESLIKLNSRTKCPVCQTPLTGRDLTTRDDVGDMRNLVNRLRNVFQSELNNSLEFKENETSNERTSVKRKPLNILPESMKPATAIKIVDHEVHSTTKTQAKENNFFKDTLITNISENEGGECSKSVLDRKKNEANNMQYLILTSSAIPQTENFGGDEILDLSMPNNKSSDLILFTYQSAFKFIKPLDLSNKKRKFNDDDKSNDENDPKQRLENLNADYKDPTPCVNYKRTKLECGNTTLGSNEMPPPPARTPCDSQAIKNVTSHAGTRTPSLNEMPPPSVPMSCESRIIKKVTPQKSNTQLLFGEESDDWMRKVLTPEPKSIQKLKLNESVVDLNSSNNEVASIVPESSLNQPPVFCYSRLKKSHMTKLQQLSVLCGGTVVKDVSKDFTHLVINLDGGRVPHTYKYLLAIARRKWVVVFEWVEKCIQQGSLVPEDSYLTSNYADCDSGVVRSRNCKKDLFAGFRFFFASGDEYKERGFTFDEIETLINSLGASVVTSVDGLEGDLIIVGAPRGNQVEYNYWLNARKWLTIGIEWIIDCILEYQIKPITLNHCCVWLDLHNLQLVSGLNLPGSLKSVLISNAALI